MLCGLLLLIAYSSGLLANPDQTSERSKYSSTLPSMNIENAASANGTDRAYSREFVLEEKVVENTRAAVEDIEPRDAERFDAPIRRNLPPLNKTFTLQLAAFKDMQQAVEYAERYQIEEEQAGVARILSKGEVWYVLAYGIYLSREDADIAKLELQAKGVPEPWVRTIATLEALANEAKENGF